MLVLRCPRFQCPLLDEEKSVMPYPARSRPQRNLTLVAPLAFAWLLGALPAHAEDKYQVHVKRGSELVRTEEYATALGQFEAAYALR